MFELLMVLFIMLAPVGWALYIGDSIQQELNCSEIPIKIYGVLCVGMAYGACGSFLLIAMFFFNKP